MDWDSPEHMRTEHEAIEFIYALVRCTKPEVIFESGTYMGHCAEAIATALDRNGGGHLWTVEASDNQYLPRDGVTFVKGDSLAYAEGFDKDIDLAFVDCSDDPGHRFSVASALWPRSKYLIAHDTTFHDPSYLEALTNMMGEPTMHIDSPHGLTLWR